MRKICMTLLVLLTVLSLWGCGGNDQAQQAIVRAPKETAAPAAAEETEAAEEAASAAFAPFVFEEQVLHMGDKLDLTRLPEPVSVYEAPSCAVEGTDLVYTYEGFELGAFDDGKGPVINSVYFAAPDTATSEGLMLGDGVDRVLELYGENYEPNGTAYVYRNGNTALNIFLQGDTVIGIEYRLLTAEQG